MSSDAQATLILLAAGWIVGVGFVRVLLVPRWRRTVGRDAFFGLLWWANRHFCRILHRVRFEGLEIVPRSATPGPLIIVSNHTGSIDPLLIQSGCPFFIRWMMASEMMSPVAADFWRTLEIIPVDRDGRDTAAAREAIRYVKAGGVVGIFPEGGIVEPRGQIRPFFDGVGLMIARTKAPVMLVWIDGTPETSDMSRSLLTPSRSRVTYAELLDFGDERDVRAITHTLRTRLSQVSGWTLTEGDAVPRFSQVSVVHA